MSEIPTSVDVLLPETAEAGQPVLMESAFSPVRIGGMAIYSAFKDGAANPVAISDG
ncbi:hypothetical protein [Prescottella equi]|uniref:hypothetical protein n=1 Tax=Rhodococcus hoagii TaxID=43767 RepID=UPI000B09945F|nr:hypothetical protein [Prescottella equi]MBM4590288.1 hypothetical protein [Prescottella equi]MBM4632097.1 hypothetical protein [Prescottella equi]MBM4632526.1 hypothetical protein [Prescottella equi]MBM4696259.1 hypothetical protein [Prescottella equi]MBM4721834.1 hypothetical protein [Prescottella equi]